MCDIYVIKEKLSIDHQKLNHSDILFVGIKSQEKFISLFLLFDLMHGFGKRYNVHSCETMMRSV